MADEFKLSEAQAKRLIKMYDEAEKEILADVNKLLLKDPESRTAEYQQRVLTRVQQIRTDLLEGSRTWCKEAIPACYIDGIKYADAEMGIEVGAKAGFGTIHQQAVQVLAENAYSRLEDVNVRIGRQVDDIFRTLTLESIRGSVVGYETVQQAARRLRDSLAERGITGFVAKNGANWKLSTYANLVATETTKQAFREGTINRLAEKGEDLVTISHHARACPICIPWEGRTLSLSGRSKEYPSLNDARGAGLFHPGCKHVISLSWEAFKSEEKSETSELRSPDFVPAKSLKEARERLTKILSDGAASYSSRLAAFGTRFKQPQHVAIGKSKDYSLELTNAILEKMEQFEKRCKALDIPMIRGLATQTKAAASMGDGILGINKKFQEGRVLWTIEKEIADLEKQIAFYNERLRLAETGQGAYRSEYYKKSIQDSINKRKEKLEMLKSGKIKSWYEQHPGEKPFNFTDTLLSGRDKVLSDLEHEFGHHIHEMLDVVTKEDFRNPPVERELKKLFTEEVRENAPTTYAKTNYKEWFAENYCAYMIGQKDRVSKECLPLIEKIVRRQSK